MMKFFYLFLLLLSTLYAQEVGVPYVDTRETVAQSAALSPDGETFYTYGNNTLTYWNLNPIRKLKTMTIDKATDFSQPLIKFNFLSNERLLIFATNEKLAVYDIHKNVFLKVIDINATLVDTLFENILVIEKNGKTKILSPDSLKSIVEGELGLYYRIHNSNPKSTHLLVKDDNQETFSIQLDNRYFRVNSKTLVPIGEFVSEGYSPVSKQKSHKFSAKIAETNSRTNSILNKIWRSFSNTKNLLIIDDTGNDLYSLYDTNSERKLVTFISFQDEHWLIFTPDGYFDGSPEARKYLYIKTASGESVPIDDATYNKFHKPIYLNDSIKDK